MSSMSHNVMMLYLAPGKAYKVDYKSPYLVRPRVQVCFRKLGYELFCAFCREQLHTPVWGMCHGYILVSFDFGNEAARICIQP